MTESEKLAWVAGFFEGEGCFRVNFSKGKYKCAHVQVAQVSREPLDFIWAYTGLGVVNGPYGPYQNNKKPYYIYNVYGEDAVEFVTELLPYLFAKGEQVKEALNELRQYQDG